MKFSPAHATPEKGKETKKQKKAKAVVAAADAADVVADAAGKPRKIRRDGFFSLETINIDTLNGEVEHAKLKKVFRMIQFQVFVLVILAGSLILGTPFFQTIYQYYAIDSSRHVVRLVALAAPNMTNQAVLSWAANSITEVMTFGFGDYRSHLIGQQARFTADGWASFVKAFYRMDIGEVFRERQLVLTTVPSDQAVILKQGPNKEKAYEWKVQMPIIMTYATNNNVTRKDTAMVTLTIVRVPPEESPGGIAIKSWVQY